MGNKVVSIKENVESVEFAVKNGQVIFNAHLFVFATGQMPHVLVHCHAVTVVECTDNPSLVFVTIHLILSIYLSLSLKFN